ncbi:Cobalamin biosynthesis protein CobT [Faunimonas pinastri]|uniref:Cobalamin biosynthesis protein CobT n=1 Tax=Faunimonas pinastri TaxID=1855383 RepID=A0A1H9MZH4_9HYPH|nr:hypothetical protein [Faunimonas pinastri]SER28927.1 Cobalamin biosynthesis protein CobT [Faunimonas pinastri]
MNRDIATLRDAIVKLTQMLTGKGLRVTQQGAQAYVESDPVTLKPVRVNIPFIPDTATEDLILAIQGFIDHEVAHVLFTDWSVVKKAAKHGKQMDQLHNIVEDTFIERAIGGKFPGSVFNVKRLHDFFIANITKTALKDPKVKGDPMREFQVLLVPICRAWSGQEKFQHFLKSEGHWDHSLVKAFVENVPEEVIKRFPKIKNSAEALDIAETLHAVLYPPKPSGAEDEGEDEGDPSESMSSGGKGSGKKKGSGEQKGKPSSSKSKPSDDDAGGEEEGKSKAPAPKKPKPAAEDDETKEKSGADDEKSGRGDKSEEDESTDADEGDEDDGAGSDEKDGDGADENEEDEEGDLRTGDGEQEDGDENSGGKGDSSGDDEDGDDGEVGAEGDGDADEGGKAERGRDTEAEASPRGSPFMDNSPDLTDADFDGALEKRITDATTRETRNAEYVLFTKDFDRIERHEVSASFKDEQLTKLDDETRHMIGVMQKDIERMMASRSQVLRVPGFRSGRLHSASLHRISAGDDRVFRRTQENNSKDTAVSLLIDNSGSMGGAPMRVAMSAGYALSQTLERVGIAHECIGFTTMWATKPAGWSAEVIRNEARRIGTKFARTEPILMPIYKGFEERLTPAVKRRFADAAMNQRFLANNVDGEAVETASLRLMPRREHRKVLLVLSDGYPAADGDRKALYSHLHASVAGATKAGIEVIGIGIMNDAVKTFYPKHMVLHDLESLPGTVMGELKRILTA